MNRCIFVVWWVRIQSALGGGARRGGDCGGGRGVLRRRNGENFESDGLYLGGHLLLPSIVLLAEPNRQVGLWRLGTSPDADDGLGSAVVITFIESGLHPSGDICTVEPMIRRT